MLEIITCPKCNRENYIDVGDLNDQTIEDIDGIICFNCKHKFLVIEEEYYDDPDYINYEEGNQYIDIDTMIKLLKDFKSHYDMGINPYLDNIYRKINDLGLK